MRPIRFIWKDVRITREWFIDEIKKDISSLFNTTTSIGSYTKLLKDLKRNLKSAIISPTYSFYWVSVLFVFSFIYFNWVVQILSGILVFIMYFKMKWMGGKPLRHYKEKYF